VKQVITRQLKQSVWNNYKHKPKVENSEREKNGKHKNLLTQFGPNWPSLGERAALRSTIMMRTLQKRYQWVTKISLPPNSTQSLNLFPWPRDSILIVFSKMNQPSNPSVCCQETTPSFVVAFLNPCFSPLYLLVYSDTKSIFIVKVTLIKL